MALWAQEGAPRNTLSRREKVIGSERVTSQEEGWKDSIIILKKRQERGEEGETSTQPADHLSGRGTNRRLWEGKKKPSEPIRLFRRTYLPREKDFASLGAKHVR